MEVANCGIQIHYYYDINYFYNNRPDLLPNSNESLIKLFVEIQF